MIFKTNDYLDKNYFVNNNNVLTIIVPLFAQCNLNCQFCYWHNNLENISKININNIINAPKFIHQQIKDTLIYYNIKAIRFVLFGGQIFMDELSDDVFASYKQLLDNIYQQFKQIQTKTIIIQSNGIYKNHKRIYDVLTYKNYNIWIKISYDQSGRFKTNQEYNLFQNSVKFFRQKNKLGNLMNVLTRPNILAMINGNNTAIQLCKKYNTFCSFQFYMPTCNYKDLALSDDLIFQHYKYCIDNNMYLYDPSLWSLYDAALGLPKTPYCNCKFEFIADINNKKLTHKCMNFISNLSDQSFLQEDAKNVNQQSFHYTNFWHGIKKRKCMQCEYLYSCGLLCWSVFNHQSFGIGQCALKRAYQYLKKTNKHLEYHNWKQNEYSQEKYAIWFNK